MPRAPTATLGGARVTLAPLGPTNQVNVHPTLTCMTTERSKVSLSKKSVGYKYKFLGQSNLVRFMCKWKQEMKFQNETEFG